MLEFRPVCPIVENAQNPYRGCPAESGGGKGSRRPRVFIGD